MTITSVAVLGAGTMGAQIALHCANAGLSVLLLDLTPELARQGLHVFLTEVVLDGERLQLDGLDVAALLALLDERTSLLAFQQFLKLMLCQSGSVRPFDYRGNLLTLRGRSDLKLSDCMAYFLVFPGLQGRFSAHVQGKRDLFSSYSGRAPSSVRRKAR